MIRLKLILPMLAFVLAIGMSFAFKNEPIVADNVIFYQGQPVEVGVDCLGNSNDCEIQLTDDAGNDIPGERYQVFGLDAEGDYTIELKTDSFDPIKVPLSTLDN